MPSRRPRRRPWGEPSSPLDLDRALGGVRHEDAADGEWTVRSVRGGAKAYRCPGCSQEIPPGVGHVVAWPRQTLLGTGLDDRRHWHSACWAARGRRRPR